MYLEYVPEYDCIDVLDSDNANYLQFCKVFLFGIHCTH